MFLEQKRAETAFKDILRDVAGKPWAKEYATLVMQGPMLLHSAGLMQTIAFWESRIKVSSKQTAPSAKQGQHVASATQTKSDKAKENNKAEEIAKENAKEKQSKAAECVLQHLVCQMEERLSPNASNVRGDNTQIDSNRVKNMRERIYQASMEEYLLLNREMASALMWYVRYTQSILKIDRSDLDNDRT